jgi:hypothetical protein
MTDSLRPPVVLDVDRQWALEQCPSWAVRDAQDSAECFDEIVDEADEPKRRDTKRLNWDWFVNDQIERFERYFFDQRKTAGDWSRLWRKSWWPKAQPSLVAPGLVPKSATPTHPVFRKGSDEFDRAMKAGSASERVLWAKLGLAQFKPDDPRLVKVVKPAPRVIRNPAGEQ